ncbi:MDR family MFS transporter [Fodinicola acaciae]|uniref:MDR family MFS transporter n=1 Tax=Fodinicola acaciae TaxID=2681555 RepID=UPI0013D616DC|nr:MDR family MFS transporter [Fodinicola acaciae]
MTANTTHAAPRRRGGAHEAPEDATPPSRGRMYVILTGVMLAMLLAMLDNMIVNTALPRIVGDLGGLSHLSWVVTAYVLASTVATPIWGKLGDLYSRKGTFIASILVFLAGSVLSGAAHSMFELIAFRALQGLGGGGLMVGAMSIMGALVPPRERGRYQGLMAAVMPLAMIGGPLLGGFITDHLDWRWAFYVNIPVGILALAVVVLTLKLPKSTVKASIDYLGVAVLSVGITALVLLTTWGGTEYAWGSWQIIGLGVLAVVSLVAFVFVERRAKEPIMPLSLFRNRNFALASVLGFLVGFAMFGATTFLPQYQQMVQGDSATQSGLALIPLMLSSVIVGLIVGQVTTRTGRYRAFPIIGGAVMTIGMVALAQLTVDTTHTMASLLMIPLGLGMGFLMQTTMLITQNSVSVRDMGVASSAATFFRQIGGSIGVSLFGAIFSSRLTASLTDSVGSATAEKLTGGGARLSPALLDKLPDAIHHAYSAAIVDGVQTLFWWAVPITAIAFVVAWFIKEVPLRGGDAPKAPAIVKQREPADALVAAVD